LTRNSAQHLHHRRRAALQGRERCPQNPCHPERGFCFAPRSKNRVEGSLPAGCPPLSPGLPHPYPRSLRIGWEVLRRSHHSTDVTPSRSSTGESVRGTFHRPVGCPTQARLWLELPRPTAQKLNLPPIVGAQLLFELYGTPGPWGIAIASPPLTQEYAIPAKPSNRLVKW
jgi:hypothetical protein